VTKVVREITKKEFKELGSLGIPVKFDYGSDAIDFYSLDFVSGLFEDGSTDSYEEFVRFSTRRRGVHKYKFYTLVEVEDG